MLKNNDGGFWRLSKGAQVSMWVIGLMLCALMYLFGVISSESGVTENTKINEIQDVKIEQNKEEIVEHKEDTKEGFEKLADEIKEQRKILNKIYHATVK